MTESQFSYRYGIVVLRQWRLLGPNTSGFPQPLHDLYQKLYQKLAQHPEMGDTYARPQQVGLSLCRVLFQVENWSPE